jgi:ABC-type nickel/cobalt efflux system permease component RcnA
VVLLTVVLVVLAAGPAYAHPLGNFSVSQYAGLTFRPDRVVVTVVVDTAEVPTRQALPAVDTDGDGQASPAERAAYAAATCRAFAAAFHVSLDGTPLSWSVAASGYVYVPPESLPTARLTCGLTAAAGLDRARTVQVDNRYLSDRVGWHELTAAGEGVRLVDCPLPATSVSDELRHYPGGTLDVRAASFRVVPGAATGAAAAASGPGGSGPGLVGGAESALRRLTGDRLSPLVVVLAVLLALVLGAGHAALPGHGKTVLAAYLAGRAGRPRDALAVGALVTLTHTAGVLAAGVLLTAFTALAGDRLLTWLQVVSGGLVTAVGLGMVAGLLRHRRAHRYDHPDEHSHPHGHEHPARPGRWGLAGIGLAGGLVPSPSALLVLLTAAGLGRTWFGVILVFVYGLGMATTLTAAGLLLVAVGTRLGRLTHLVGRYAPRVTAALVVLVGLGLTLRGVLAV